MAARPLRKLINVPRRPVCLPQECYATVSSMEIRVRSLWLHAHPEIHPALLPPAHHHIVVMPASALDTLSRLNVVYPMMFRVTNDHGQRSTFCGVLEFSAPEGVVYLPSWVRSILALCCPSSHPSLSSVCR